MQLIRAELDFSLNPGFVFKHPALSASRCRGSRYKLFFKVHFEDRLERFRAKQTPGPHPGPAESATMAVWLVG